jgi:hypothetical protein
LNIFNIKSKTLSKRNISFKNSFNSFQWKFRNSKIKLIRLNQISQIWITFNKINNIIIKISQCLKIKLKH